MEMLINDKVPLADIQKEFNNEFHFLKLEFYAGVTGKATEQKPIIVSNRDVKVGDCRRLKKDGILIISQTQTVEEVENMLAQNFGLIARILRNSYNLWIE